MNKYLIKKKNKKKVKKYKKNGNNIQCYFIYSFVNVFYFTYLCNISV